MYNFAKSGHTDYKDTFSINLVVPSVTIFGGLSPLRQCI